MRDALHDILTACHALPASVSLEPMGRGYTNESFSLRGGGRPMVLRLGWAGKPPGAAEREEAVLRFLARQDPTLPAPRPIETLQGRPHATVGAGPEARPVHLFGRLPGRALYHWKDRCTDAHLLEIARLLARLHAALAPMPRPSEAIEDPLGALQARLSQVAALWASKRPWAAPSTAAFLEGARERFVAAGQKILDEARRAPWAAPEAVLWTHGDFQLENFLFEGEALVGVVDFDTVRCVPRAFDVAASLFGVVRRPHNDAAFEVDAPRFARALARYDDAALSLGLTPMTATLTPHESWSAIFCLDQACLHLSSGLRGLWRLEPGIGFSPSFAEVMKA